MLALVLAATLSIEDHVLMPAPSTPKWSPDGTRIAYVLTKPDLARNINDSDVWLIDADGRNDRRLTFGAGSDFRPRWSPDGSLIAFLSDRGGRNAIYVLDPRGGEARIVSAEPTPVREFEWSPDGKQISFTRIDEQPADEPRVVDKNIPQVHLYLADVATGKTRKLTSGEFSVFDHSWSPDGTELAIARGPAPGFDALQQTDVYLVSALDGAMRPLVVRPGHDRSVKFSPDGKWIAFTSAGGTPHWVAEFDVYVIPAKGGQPREVSAAYDRTPDAMEWSDDSRSIWIEGPWNTSSGLFRVNADGTGFTNTFPQKQVSDVAVHGNQIAYIGQSLTSPPELFVDRQQLTHHNDAYRNRELGETRLIRWKNPKDGLEIEGLLTLPAGYQSGRVPLITFVHGGPASHFNQNYLGYLGVMFAPQALAANGFAILRPNPRGSGAYGLAFRAANRADWGGLDWLDVNAGIDKVIADGIADPQRLGLMGWSYGGYLAAWAIGNSNRFRAITVGAGITDLVSYHGTADIREFIPSYFEGMPLDLLRARSPIWNLKKTGAKVLILHGENDERVPLTQSTMLYRMLDELGVDVTMVIYPRSAHGLREPKLRIDMAKRNLELFAKTLR